VGQSCGGVILRGIGRGGDGRGLCGVWHSVGVLTQRVS
jgi:hypothetical protein